MNKNSEKYTSPFGLSPWTSNKETNTLSNNKIRKKPVLPPKYKFTGKDQSNSLISENEDANSNDLKPLPKKLPAIKTQSFATTNKPTGFGKISSLGFETKPIETGISSGSSLRIGNKPVGIRGSNSFSGFSFNNSRSKNIKSSNSILRIIDNILKNNISTQLLYSEIEKILIMIKLLKLSDVGDIEVRDITKKFKKCKIEYEIISDMKLKNNDNLSNGDLANPLTDNNTKEKDLQKYIIILNMINEFEDENKVKLDNIIKNIKEILNIEIN